MFGYWAFDTDDWNWKPALVEWKKPAKTTTAFSKVVSDYASFCVKKGRHYVRVLRGQWNSFACSSFRRECNKQYSVEPCNSVSKVPFTDSCGNGLREGYDKVESVVRVCEEATVYDIQVAENHNLFANGILCHNCLILDDPIKAREDADSEASRRRLRDWYTSVAYTRLMDNGSIVVCQTRWHTDDITGWLLKEHKHEKWVVLNLPAINSKGEALWPEKYPLKVLNNIKKTLPRRDWEALYQQKPFIEEGGIFKRQWWNKWPDHKPLPECSFILQSWDTATTDKDLKSNSYSARTTWGVFKRADDAVPNVILLDRWKERVEFPELEKEAMRAYQDYQPDKVIIEKKSSGQQLIQILRRMGLPLVEFLPEKIGDKTARAYAAQFMFENGRVYYPDRRWAEEVIDDLAQFSPSSPNDITDTVTMAIIWLQKSWFLQHSEMKEASEEEDDNLPNHNRRLRLIKKRAAYG